jgi:hypothetical protein
MAETPQTKPEEQDDQQHSWLGDVVRVTILLWSMGILTANYLGIFSQAVDPTFPASLLTGTAATYTPALGKIGKKKKEENGVIVDNSKSSAGIK